MLGSVFGVTSIWTMVFIALDRYNVIVKVKQIKQTIFVNTKYKLFIWYIFINKEQVIIFRVYLQNQ